jgi:hypothetical protein
MKFLEVMALTLLPSGGVWIAIYLRFFNLQCISTSNQIKTTKLKTCISIKKGIGYKTNNINRPLIALVLGGYLFLLSFNNHHHHTLLPPHPLPLPRHKRQNSPFGPLALRVPRSWGRN